jgi:5-methylcytosine-specific restriction endonuclease McrA
MGIKPENYQKIRAHFIKLMWSKCAYCGSKEQLEFDHIYPSKISMSKLGTSKRVWHWFDELAKGNLQLLCARCNNTKNDSYPVYFSNCPGMI